MGYPGRYMVPTLVFKLKGISDKDWYKIRLALNTDNDPNTGANSTCAWGFKEIMDEFEFKNPRLDAVITAGGFAETLTKLAEIYGVEVTGKINKYLDTNAALSADLVEDIFAGDEEILDRWLEKQEVRENIEKNGGLVTRGAAFMLIKEYIETKSR